MAMQFYPRRSVDTIYSLIKNYADSAVIHNAWSILEKYNTAEDHNIAVQTLKGDANTKNRILAVGVLANFFASDSTWWTLVDAFRDPNDNVSGVAGSITLSQAKVHPQSVNWDPAAFSLRAILDGTNLFAFQSTVEILTLTKVSPKLSPALLKRGGTLLLAYLNAHRVRERDIARHLLIRLADKDYGSNVENWKVWIDSL